MKPGGGRLEEPRARADTHDDAVPNGGFARLLTSVCLPPAEPLSRLLLLPRPRAEGKTAVAQSTPNAIPRRLLNITI